MMTHAQAAHALEKNEHIIRETFEELSQDDGFVTRLHSILDDGGAEELVVLHPERASEFLRHYAQIVVTVAAVEACRRVLRNNE